MYPPGSWILYSLHFQDVVINHKEPETPIHATRHLRPLIESPLQSHGLETSSRYHNIPDAVVRGSSPASGG